MTFRKLRKYQRVDKVGICVHDGRHYKAKVYLKSASARPRYKVMVGDEKDPLGLYYVTCTDPTKPMVQTTLDEYWPYRKIVGHDSCRPYWMQVKWQDGSTTKVDVMQLSKDDPQSVKEYMVKKRLNKVKAWNRVWKQIMTGGAGHI